MTRFVDEVTRNRTVFIDDKHLMFLMGQDFTFQNANVNYKNLDKLIKHMNAQKEKYKMNLVYSTPSCYVKALNDAGHTWPTKTDDYFPHANGENGNYMLT